MNKSKLVKIGLSVFLAFHLFAIVLAPNSQTYLGGRTASVIQPYVSFLEIASQWGFFAPDPGPPPVFIEYEIIGDGGESLRTGSWPEKKDPFWLRERQNRRIGVARFLIASNERTEKVMGPYLCKTFHEAHSVKLWRVIEPMASLHDIAAGRRKIGDGMETQRKWVSQYLCGARS